MEDKVYRSIYISVAQSKKLERVASNRDISWNKLICLLIDSLQEVDIPPLSIEMPKEREKVSA